MTRTDISKLARANLRRIRRAMKRDGNPGAVALAHVGAAIRVATARNALAKSASSAITPFLAWEFREGLEAMTTRPEAQLEAVVATLRRNA